MEKQFEHSMLIGDLVAAFPAAADVLKDYRIDFCCGGNRPLTDVLKESGLPEKEIFEKLNRVCDRSNLAGNTETDWRGKSFGEIIDYVVQVHHGYLNQALPEISSYTTKILRVHGGNHPELEEVHRLFHTLKMDMEQHMIKEESDAFPEIRKYEEEPVRENLERCTEIVRKLEEEHAESGDLLKRLRSVTRDYTLPDDACATYQLTFQNLEELESDMFRHVHLENNILFPRLMAQLAAL